MASAEAEDWRVGLSLNERLKYVLEGQYKSEITFLLGEGDTKVIVKAHKLPLICGSAVFEGMIERWMPDDKHIAIEDVDPDAFKMMLSFLYCEEVSITAENVMSLMYISKKYLISHLSEKCSAFLQTQIKIDNVCKILEDSILYTETSLTESCIDFISDNISSVLKTEGFKKLSNESLQRVIQSDDLELEEEMEVYTACVEWADECCSKNKTAVNDSERRAVLGEALYMIRFPTMPIKDFAEMAVSSSLLTGEEKADVYGHLVLHGDTSSTCDCTQQFSKISRIRDYRKSVTIDRFQSSSGSSGWANSSEDIIDFVCDKKALLEGCSVYTCYGISANHVAIKLIDQQGNDLSVVSSVKLSTSKTCSSTRASFQNPVKLRAGRKYSVILDRKGVSTYYNSSGQSVVKADGLTVSFYNSSKTTSTNVSKGQLPRLHFKI